MTVLVVATTAACAPTPAGSDVAPTAPASAGSERGGVPPSGAAPVPTEPVAPVAPDGPEEAGKTRDPLADLVESELESPSGPGPTTSGRDRIDGAVVLGADAGWPQCPAGMGIPQKRSHGGPMPVAEAEYVILGLTNGPGFYENPCLADQVAWVRERGMMIGAYSVASYPEARFVEAHGRSGPYDGGTRLGALANTGYQQAVFNVAAMDAAGLVTPAVWIDVEPVPDFAWSTDLEANAAVVGGIARGYRDAGFRLGVYSTPSLWRGVVGDAALGLPEWRAAGQTSRDEALRRCEDDWTIQGGPAVLGQWVQDSRDMNLTCPGAVVDLAEWFHRY